MKTIFSILVILTAVGCTRGCGGGDPYSNKKFTPMDMRLFEEDLIVPSALWKSMEKVYRPMAMDAEGRGVKEGIEEEGQANVEGSKEEKEDLLKKRPPLDPISIHVYLVEKTPGVLGGHNYHLKYPLGGGQLDYRYFIPETKDGSFRLYIKYEPDLDGKEARIFYLSNAKIRDFDGEPLGNGCNRYFDISDYWKSNMNDGGLTLNTTKNRHISVTSGVLFFVAPYKGKLRISHLTIRDGRHPELMCSTSEQE